MRITIWRRKGSITPDKDESPFDNLTQYRTLHIQDEGEECMQELLLLSADIEKLCTSIKVINHDYEAEILFCDFKDTTELSKYMLHEV